MPITMDTQPRSELNPAESAAVRRSRSLGRDLQNPRWMVVKAAGFVVIGVFACTLVLIESPRWDIAAYLALAVWAFARAYYFAFYVIERYIDPEYRYDGLISAIRHVRKKSPGNDSIRTESIVTDADSG